MCGGINLINFFRLQGGTTMDSLHTLLLTGSPEIAIDGEGPYTLDDRAKDHQQNTHQPTNQRTKKKKKWGSVNSYGIYPFSIPSEPSCPFLFLDTHAHLL